MGEIIRMIVVLSVICGLSGLTLATVRDATSARIELQELNYVKGPAIQSVLGQHDNDPLVDRRTFDLPDGGKVTVFPAMQGGKLTSLAFETSGKGFGGDLGVMVGFDTTKDTLSGVGITTLKETPGVGSRVTLPSFTAQFAGHGLDNLALTKSGGDIDGVTGATISSTAAMEAVNKAVAIYKAIGPELASAWGKGN